MRYTIITLDNEFLSNEFPTVQQWEDLQIKQVRCNRLGTILDDKKYCLR